MPGLELHWINASDQGPTKYNSQNTADHQIIAIEHGKIKTISRSASALQSLIVNELSDTIYFPSARVISRQHAKILWWDDDAVIEEQGSTHGIYIAQRNAHLGADGYWIEQAPEAKLDKVTDVAYLRPGDYVQLGKECGSGSNEYHPVRLYVSVEGDTRLARSLKSSYRHSSAQVAAWNGFRKLSREPQGSLHPTIGLSEGDAMSDYDSEGYDLQNSICVTCGPSDARDKTSTPSESVSFEAYNDSLSETNEADSFVSEASSIEEKTQGEGQLHQQVEQSAIAQEQAPNFPPSEDKPSTDALGSSGDSVSLSHSTAVTHDDKEPDVAMSAIPSDLISESSRNRESANDAGAVPCVEAVSSGRDLHVLPRSVANGTKRSAVESIDSESDSESYKSSSPPTSCASTSSSPPPVKRLRVLHPVKLSRRHSERKMGSLRAAGKILRGVVYTASLFSIGFLSGSVFTFKAVMNTAAQVAIPPNGSV